MNHAWDWLVSIPPVSRAYLIGATLVSIGCYLDFVSPLALYYNARLIGKGQLWRLVTCFLYFGTPGVDFAIHLYFLHRYSRFLEESPEYLGRTSDFVWLMLFSTATISLIAPFLSLTFFGSSMSFMMVYIWSRRNEHQHISFLGVFNFRAPYLPFVLMMFAIMTGQNITNTLTVDGLGVLVGHLYYYFEDVYPVVWDIRKWAGPRRPLSAPSWLRQLLGEHDPDQLRVLPPLVPPVPDAPVQL